MKFSIVTLLLFLGMASAAQNPTRLNVYFEFDEAQLTAVARQSLDEMIAAKKELPGLTVELHGYCDYIGSEGYNDALSLRRVEVVRAHLLAGGIPAGVITETRHYGEKNPVNDNKTEDQRKLNRRVELIIANKASDILSKTTTDSQFTPPPEKPVSLQKQIEDSSVTAGSNIILRNINFYGGRSLWLSESQSRVDEILEAMKNVPGLVIEIHGHICCLPGPDDGPDIETGVANLSEARAKAIHDFLISNGIAPGRVSYKGFGHSNPIYPYPEKSMAEQTLNRRVEIKIISK